MFLRCHKQKKNGKLHQYYTVVENRRIANDRVVQKTVLYLGAITHDQEKAWRKTLEVFDVDQNKPVYKYLFATARFTLFTVMVGLGGSEKLIKHVTKLCFREQPCPYQQKLSVHFPLVEHGQMDLLVQGYALTH